MEMLPDGSGCVGTGTFQTLKTDSLVLAVGQHADVEFLKKVPELRVGRGNVVEVDAHMRAGTGIFAGGDMIGGARTMTSAVGHGKKAARNIDAFLRGTVYQKPALHPSVPYEKLNLTVFLDAERRQQAELPVAQRTGFEEIVSGLSEREARYEASRCLSCGNCFECDNCYAACPEQAIVKLGKGRFYRVELDLCTGCAACFERVRHAIEMAPEPGAATRSETETVPARFTVRT
jgi:Pyruvate/2-oxoacid:ferredoxin oxidoreductase delta subunit